MNRFTTFVIAIAAVLVASVPAHAGQSSQGSQGSQGSQSAQAPSVDARWLPWIGCWRPVNQRAPEEGVHICVVPAGAGARIMTIAGDRAVVDETIIPDGTAREVEETTCRGSRRSEWSADGQRIYSGAELTCDKQPARKVSGLSVLTDNAEWIDVQVVTAGAQENVRVRRYRRSSDQPPDASLIPADLAARAARTALGTRLSIDQIIEASSKVTPRVLEALVFETKTHFPLDSHQLIALDDAGVPDTVIDLMVAFSFPKKFEVKRSAGGSSSSGEFGGFGGFGGFGWGGFGVSADQAWPWYYDPYYSYFSPFGYNSWNYWDGYYYGPGTGVIAGGGSTTPTEGHGRVVNGSGYTQVTNRGAENDGQAGQRLRTTGDSSTDSGGWSSGSSGGSSGVSSGGYSSGGGGGDSGRTAVPR